MEGEILSIETTQKIAALEKENKELKNNMYKAAEMLKLNGELHFGDENAHAKYSRDTIIDLLKLLKVGD